MKTLVILGILIQGITCLNDAIEVVANTDASPNMDYMIQRATVSMENVNQLFWSEEKKCLVYADFNNDRVYRYNYNGTVIRSYIKQISGENMVFVIPIKNTENTFLVASDQYLRVISINGNNVTVSDPVFDLSVDGYVIQKGHTDKDGILYILVTHILRRDKGSILYKFYGRNKYLIYALRFVAWDFAFSNDFQKVYIIGNYGKSVYTYINKGNTISQEIETYNVKNDNLNTVSMTSAVEDNESNLWVSTDHSYVLRLNSKHKLTKIVQTPSCGLTSIVFGGNKMSDLFVGSTTHCHRDEWQAGSIFQISGLPTEGNIEKPVDWPL